MSSKAGTDRRWVLAAGTFGLAAWASCNVYDASLLTGPGAGVASVDGARGGAESGGRGGAEVAGGRGGSSGSATGGGSGAGAGGTAADGGKGATSAGGAGGSSGTSGKGSGGGAGKAGASASAGTIGMAGADMGEGGAPDCMTLGDCCPDDPDKTEPGSCGCGSPDTDADLDATPDCNDLCPLDATRTAPGECGCDVVGDEADCAALKSALVHRYSFSGSGTIVTDSKGSLDGTVKGVSAMLSGAGTLALAGGVVADAKQQYVDLGTDCLAGLVNATFEGWVTWSTTCSGSGCTNALDWQRVFDFGETGTASTGSYVFLTPRAGRTNNPVFAAGSSTGSDNELTTGFRAYNASALTAGAHHFALVVDDANHEARVFLDGAQIGTGAYATVASLASINVTECFLGRSHYPSDPYLNGTFDEFRIYDAALSASALALSYAAGPNPSFYQSSSKRMP